MRGVGGGSQLKPRLEAEPPGQHLDRELMHRRVEFSSFTQKTPLVCACESPQSSAVYEIPCFCVGGSVSDRVHLGSECGAAALRQS